MEPLPLWCDVCSQLFSGPIPAQQHFQSSKHMKKMGNAAHFNKSDSYCGICNIQCDTLKILKDHESSPRHHAMVEKQNRLSNSSSLAAETRSSEKGPSPAGSTNNEDRDYIFNGSRGYCYLCKIELTSESHAGSHINGKNHLKKCKQKQFEVKPTIGKESATGLLDETPMGPEEFCNVCRVPFTGSDCARQHYTSERHRKKVALLQYQQEFVVQENSAKHYTSQSNLESASSIPNDNGKNDEKALWQKEKLLGTSNFSFCHNALPESAGTSENGKKAEIPKSAGIGNMKCDLCQVFLSGLENAQQHYTSEKHKKKLLSQSTEDNMETLSCNFCDVHFTCASNKRDHMASVKHKKLVALKEKEESGDLLPLSCEVCDCQFTGQESAEAHFSSKKHKRNEENRVIQNKCSFAPHPANVQTYVPSDLNKALPTFVHKNDVMNERENMGSLSNLNEASHHLLRERQGHGLNDKDENKVYSTFKDINDDYKSDDDSFLAKPISADFDDNGTSHDFEGNSFRMPVPIGNERSSSRSVCDQLSSLSIKTSPIPQTVKQEISSSRFSNALDDPDVAMESLGERKIVEDTQTSLRPKLSDILLSDLSNRSNLTSTISDAGTVHDDQPVQFIRNNLQPQGIGRGRAFIKMCNLFNDPNPGHLNNTSKGRENMDTEDYEEENDESKLRRFILKINKQERGDTVEDTIKREPDIITQRPGPLDQYQVLQYAAKSKLLEEQSTELEPSGREKESNSPLGSNFDAGFQGNQSTVLKYTNNGGDYCTHNNTNTGNLDTDNTSNMLYSTVSRQRRLSTDSNRSGTMSEGSLKGTNSEGSIQGSVNHDEYRFSDTAERGWCNVCSIDLTSKMHMRQHVHGQKHMKAREVWAAGGILNDIRGSSYMCDVCNMTFSGPEPQKQHFESLKHKTKVRQCGTVGQEYFCDICKVPCSGEASYAQHLAGAQHCKMSGRRASSTDGIDQTIWYTCDICKCQLNTRQQLEIHKQSPRHLAKAEQLQRIGTDTNDEFQNEHRPLLDGVNLAKHHFEEDCSDQPSLLDKFLSEPLFPNEPVFNESREFMQGRPTEEPKPLIKPEVTDEPVPVMKRYGMPLGAPAQTVYTDSDSTITGTGNAKSSQGSEVAWATRSRATGTSVKNDIRGGKPERDALQSSPRQAPVPPLPSENVNPYAATHAFYCRTCKVPMNTQVSYEAHVQGKRHMTKVSNEKAPDRVHMAKYTHGLDAIPKTKTVPRNYQVELFKKSVKLDTLCFLPTGTGKTMVSVLTMCHMLQEFPSKNVLFLVDKVLLVLQQSKYIKQQIGGNHFARYNQDSDNYQELVRRQLNIAAVCMGQQSTDGIPMWKHDVVIVTAAFCKNLLDQGILKWTDFSLVVFDEAHHCEKSHPFNTLLQHYHNQVMIREEAPKILGLTASPAGKSDLPKTIVMLENLLANMGCAFMNVVEEQENVTTLKAIQSNAKMFVKVQGTSAESDLSGSEELKRLLMLYAIDCLKCLSKISNIESYVDLDWTVFDSRNISYSYFEQNLDAVQSCLGLISSETMEKVQFSMFTTHISYICMTYNSLLEGGVLCALEEISQMESTEANFRFAKSIQLSCDLLHNAFVNLGQNMLSSPGTGSDMSHKSGFHIESLLKELLLANEGNRPSNRKPISLVLVKQRGTAHKICTVLNSSVEMQRRGLKSAMVVGHGGTGAADKGMSVNQQKRILEEIKQHVYQVVIATSVAEEGVDWPECDCVISMYPPSTVTALVQMRGRARIKHSKFIILCNSETEKEKLQDIMRREENMMEATRIIVQQQHRLASRSTE